MFSAERIFEGQNKSFGVSAGTPGTTKAAALDATTELLKPTNKASVNTRLVVHNECKVEETLVDLTGDPTTKPSFYKIENEEWAQYPTLLMVLGLMVHRKVDDGFVQQEAEEQDFS